MKLSVHNKVVQTGGNFVKHSFEKLLMAKKGEDFKGIRKERVNNVVQASVRITNQKPTEIYMLIETLLPGARLLELFGRKVNARNYWITIGDDFFFTPGVPRAEFA